MADNEEVMTHWAQFSSEGMTRSDANELLMGIYETI